MSFFSGVAETSDNKVISNDFYALKPLHKFVHGSLPYFWSGTDTEGHAKPTVASEGSVERRFVA